MVSMTATFFHLGCSACRNALFPPNPLAGRYISCSRTLHQAMGSRLQLGKSLADVLATCVHGRFAEICRKSAPIKTNVQFACWLAALHYRITKSAPSRAAGQCRHVSRLIGNTMGLEFPCTSRMNHVRRKRKSCAAKTVTVLLTCKSLLELRLLWTAFSSTKRG